MAQISKETLLIAFAVGAIIIVLLMIIIIKNMNHKKSEANEDDNNEQSSPNNNFQDDSVNPQPSTMEAPVMPAIPDVVEVNKDEVSIESVDISVISNTYENTSQSIETTTSNNEEHQQKPLDAFSIKPAANEEITSNKIPNPLEDQNTVDTSFGETKEEKPITIDVTPEEPVISTKDNNSTE